METEYLLCRFGVHLLDLFQYIERIVLQPHHIGIVEFPLELVNTVLSLLNSPIIAVAIDIAAEIIVRITLAFSTV